jgi:hypothetical protein
LSGGAVDAGGLQHAWMREQSRRRDTGPSRPSEYRLHHRGNESNTVEVNRVILLTLFSRFPL